MPLTQNLQIKRDDKGRTLGVLGPLDQPCDVIFVAHGVELEPERLGRCFGHILDRVNRHRRKGKRHAKGFGGAGCFDFSVGVLHAGQTDRGKRHRHRHILTDHLCGGRPPAHIYGHALAQADLVKIRSVFAEGLLRPAT